MDAITLTLTALKAGASAIANVATEETIKLAYKHLKEFVQKKFAGKPKDEITLDEYEKDSETWGKPLAKALDEAGVDKDQDIIQAAQNLMQLIDPKKSSEGQYNISAKNIIGSAIGNNPSVTNQNIHLGDKQD